MFSRRPRSLAVGPFRESLSLDDGPKEIGIEAGIRGQEVGPRDGPWIPSSKSNNRRSKIS